MSLIDTVREVATLSVLVLETGPDIGTGTVADASGASETLADPTKVVKPEVAVTFTLATVGSKLAFVTDI